MSARPFGKLDRKAPHAASPSVDQYPFALCELAVVEQPLPRSETRQGHRSGLVVRQSARLGCNL